MKINIPKKKIIIVFTCILLIIIFAKLMIWDKPNNKWIIQDLYYKSEINDKLTLSTPILQTNEKEYSLNDASKLNKISVSRLITPQSKIDIINAVLEAKKTNKKVSISGARHSMGGQIGFQNSVHLDMLKYDKISYDSQNSSVTVESGATWKQIQLELTKHNRAIRVMQDSNIFTVGGSVGSNVHGKDVRYGSLVEGINWMKIINSDGIEKMITPADEIFKYVIGGFGLFGVVTEVNLKTDPNTTYEYFVENIKIENFPKKFTELLKDENLEQLEAQVSVSNNNLLKDTQIYYFKKTDKTSDKISTQIDGESSIWLRKLVYRISRESDFGKSFRWWMQSNIGPLLDPKLISRNAAMAAPFRTLQLEDEKTTDILQEYFVPIEKTDEFIDFYRGVLEKNNINIINCTIRKVNKDTQATLSYAKSDMLGFVCYYKINKDDSGEKEMKKIHQEIGKWLVENNGSFYLTYKNYYPIDIVKSIYPELNEFKKKKNIFDPNELFYSQWYDNLKN